MSLHAPLHPDALRLLPLGGLGEIGLNMMAVECRGDILLIDCGLMFPEAYMMGIDLVIPDVTPLLERVKDIRGLVLTHGHEDHIGAIPFLLDTLGNPPIFGTPLTLGLLQNKLDEHHLLEKASLNPIEPGVAFTLGCFGIEPFRVAHSIVDGVGFAIRTPAGLVVHTGDFKLDLTPVDSQPTDLARLAAYGKEGVLLLLADSTNVEKEGYTLSERTVGEALQEIVPRCPGKVLVSTFSSNIHRIQQVADAAVAAGRQILVIGRSMVANIAIARQLGYLQMPDDILVDVGQARHLPADKLLIIATGSQGEPRSALSRIALDDHKQIKLEQGDTVILSSKFIPGNEKAISEVINHLYRRGAEVFYESTSEIHVSGHASREELKLVHSLIRPRYFVPVHGEYRHLVKHAQLAQSMGMAPSNTLVLENGTPLVLSRNGVTLEGKVETGRVFIDGKGVGDVGTMELRDRSHLANHGLVVVLLALNQASGRVIYGPELFSRGFVPEEESRPYLDEAAQAVSAMLAEHSLAAMTDWEELRVEVRKTLRRFFNKTIDRRPLILPVILEL
ncbi:ribonuclease J [Desulfuromonas sp. AOP6]|uniref:ribonuclease J n=1 Tax=Desulfuromonas sp. AOP6 TaxID=1566351 RepID=UPI0012737B01|nr:ribonuclease J [Desulfuromonas sp. AOP6]BCA78802.1 ribonuclease J [Desulfuromonas sp. AOP6]